MMPLSPVSRRRLAGVALATALLHFNIACRPVDPKVTESPPAHELALAINNDSLESIRFCVDLWIAHTRAGELHVSRNGADWTQPALGKKVTVHAMGCGENRFLAIAPNSEIVTYDGSSWAITSSNVDSGRAQDPVFADGRWVFVSRDGSITSSANGTDWRTVRAAAEDPFANGLGAVAFGNGLWVAVGDWGAILTSQDAQSWEDVEAEPPPGTRGAWAGSDLKVVSFANGKWVATGDTGGIVTSSDGIRWRWRRDVTNADLDSIAYGNGYWVLVGEGGRVFVSPDAQKWERRRPTRRPREDDFLDVAPGLKHVRFADGRFVAVDEEDDVVTSTDALNWTEVRVTIGTEINEVNYSNGLWVGVGEANTIVTSKDAAKWTLVRGGSSAFMRHIEFADGNWVGVGDDGGIAVSKDGVTWIARSLPNGSDLSRVKHARGLWIAAGNGIYTSTDTVEWRPGKLPRPLYVSDVENSSGQWMAVGEQGTILSSEDGIEWVERRRTNDKESLNSVATNSRQWVAVGSDGLIVASNDGVLWTRQTSGTTVDLNAVGFAAGQWIAVGNGVVLSSTDGREWKVRWKGSTYLETVGHSQGQWVAAGGAIFSSSDGLAWRPANASDEGTYYDLRFNAGHWLAIGNTVVTSENGVDWTTVGTRTDLMSAAYGNDRWVGVGFNRSAVIRRARELPRITDARYQFSPAAENDALEVTMAGPPDACPESTVTLSVWAQEHVNHTGVEQLPLRLMGEPQKAVLRSSPTTLRLAQDLKPLNVRDGDRFWYSVKLLCGTYTAAFPRYSAAQQAVYATQWPVNAWWLTAAGLVAALIVLGSVMHIFAPLVLLKWRYATIDLGPLAQVRIPVLGIVVGDLVHALNLWLVPLLVSTERPQDAWVQRYAEEWRTKGFENEAVVRRFTNYVPLPVSIGTGSSRDTLDKPGVELLPRLWHKDHPWVEIIGPGGAGKTMLAVRIGYWCLQQRTAGSTLRRLPVVIDEETDDVLAVVTRKLRAALLSTIHPEFVRTLIRSGRIVLIFDRLSEQKPSAFDNVAKLRGTLPLAAGLVTSRRPVPFEGTTPLQLFPLELSSASVLYFMTTLLKEHNEGAFASMAEQMELAQRLARIFATDEGSETFTPLLVRLFVDRAVRLRKSGGGFDSLPGSIPETYFEYLRALNPEDPSVPHALTHTAMLQCARTIAAASLAKLSFPEYVPVDALRSQLASHGQNADPIERLTLNGVLIGRFVGTRYMVRFALDPIAEYLAADQFLEDCAAGAQSYAELIEPVRANGPAAEGLLVALEASWRARKDARSPH
jgi:hypothetical protein